MQQRLIELHQQRGRLVERINAQRQSLSQHLVPLDRALDVGDRVARMVQDTKAFVLRHPLAIAALLVTVVVLRPGTVLRWSQRGLLAWRTWRTVRPLLPGFLLSRWRDQV